MFGKWKKGDDPQKEDETQRSVSHNLISLAEQYGLFKIWAEICQAHNALNNNDSRMKDYLWLLADMVNSSIKSEQKVINLKTEYHVFQYFIKSFSNNQWLNILFMVRSKSYQGQNSQLLVFVVYSLTPGTSITFYRYITRYLMWSRIQFSVLWIPLAVYNIII